jgi:hypothetical protein
VLLEVFVLATASLPQHLAQLPQHGAVGAAEVEAMNLTRGEDNGGARFGVRGSGSRGHRVALLRSLGLLPDSNFGSTHPIAETSVDFTHHIDARP